MDVYKIDETKEIEMVVNSFVSEPATEKEWLFFNRKKQVLNFYDDEKQIVTSVVMLANTPIYRNDDGYEYKLVFTPEAIKKMAFDYFSKNGFNKISIEHDGKEIEGAAILLESYFVDSVKSVPQKFGKIPYGSWIMSYKVVDKDLWTMIKEKKLRGFSIEVVADLKKLNLNLSKNINQQNKKNMKKEKNKTKEKFLDAVTDQGVQVRFDALEDGQLIYAVAEDGTEVLLEQGTYLINYEDVVYEVVVDENGTITEINEVSSEESMSNEDVKKTLDEMNKKIAEIEEKINTFMTAKPTAKKTKPLTDDSNSNVRTDFSKIKVKF
ncbi:MAG: hypothetical protein PWQ14_1185 [Rikenellaceae bacterium]|nr:hypothetical protein [Rikenellaceae bacterium]